MRPQIKVLFDCNTWISFSMGGRLKQLENLLPNPYLEIFSCQILLDEFENVVKRPHLNKYLQNERVLLARKSLETVLVPFQMTSSAKPISRDSKDDYMLHFSFKYSLNYLVTGDKDLLVLEQYHNTRILTFSNFIKELETLKVI